MIHAFLGTKAQYVKTAPVLRELQARGVPYRLIDSGQHAALSGPLREFFDLPEPDVRLRADGDNLSTVPALASWFGRWLARAVMDARGVRRQVFGGEGGVCLIHGDTATTYLSCRLAQSAGVAVAHVEAGLRSFRVWDPFPEELVRILCMREARVLYAPSDWAEANLRRMGARGEIVPLGGNTVLDAVRLVEARGGGGDLPSEPFVVATCHRAETIYSPPRLRFLVELLGRIAAERRVLFVMHEPTRRRLASAGLLDAVRASCECLPLLEYPEFLRRVARAEFVLTDGGSIQEESFYLGVPCLVLRSTTERNEGLGGNVCLAGFHTGRVQRFLGDYATYRERTRRPEGSPSARLVDHLLAWNGRRRSR